MQSPFDIAADLDTPVSAYLKLKPFRPRFLLESVEAGEQLGRYSFLGFGDALEVRLEGGTLRVDGSSVPAPDSPAALLAALGAALERAPRPGPAPAGVPFAGGLVGVTGYAMARRLADVGGCGRAVPRSDAREPDAVYVAPRSVLVFDHLTRRIALLHDGPESEARALRREVVSALRGGLPARGPSGCHAPASPSLDERAFGAAVEAAQRHIAAGDVYQLVLSIRFAGACDVAPFEVYRALRLLNPSPYLYFFDCGDLALAGSSPEALVRLRGRAASLRPIAGTRPRGADAAADRALEEALLADPKEAAEHVMLVDLARNDLGRVAATGTVRVEPFRSVERYSHVMHLVSGVHGVLAPGTGLFEIGRASCRERVYMPV
jgi:anthranilate synthase component 1